MIKASSCLHENLCVMCMIRCGQMIFYQKLNGTLPTDPKVTRAIRYSGLLVLLVISWKYDSNTDSYNPQN